MIVTILSYTTVFIAGLCLGVTATYIQFINGFMKGVKAELERQRKSNENPNNVNL